MWPWKRSSVSKTQAQAEKAIASSLGGGDSLPAWNAIWDLVQSHDAQGKKEILDDLRSYVTSTATGEAAERARSFEHALDQSLRPRRLPADPSNGNGIVRHARVVPPSNEVRDQGARDRIEGHRTAMRKIGVRPGDGIPMWALYMTRRNKRSWG